MNCFYLKRYGLKAKGFLTQSLTFFAVEKQAEMESSENSVGIFLVRDYFKDIGKKYRNLDWISCLSYKSWLVCIKV